MCVYVCACEGVVSLCARVSLTHPDINDESVPFTLGLLLPKLQEQNVIVRKLAVLPALQASAPLVSGA